MLYDYEFKGKKGHFFIESNANKEVIQEILDDYKQQVKTISKGGLIRHIKRYGYRVDELISSDNPESKFNFE